MNVEVAADPRFQPQALQPGGSQHQSAVLPLVQLPQPGLQIAPHGLHIIAGVELFQLDAAAQAGGADGFVRVRRIRAFRHSVMKFRSGGKYTELSDAEKEHYIKTPDELKAVLKPF